MPDFSAAFQQLEQYLSAYLQTARTPGLALVLFDNQQNHFVTSYGYHNLEAQNPVTKETLFEIGSITKSFTALAIMQAAEAGLLDLYAPITQYLPWLSLASASHEILRIIY